MTTKQTKQVAGTIINNLETPELLASAIRDVAASAAKLLNGPLSRRAICLLIRDRTAVGMGDIERVLIAAAQLNTFLVKPAPATGLVPPATTSR